VDGATECAATPGVGARSREHLLAAYRRVRQITEDLSEPLSAEDQILQSMPDASPAKWHRAHTTWFFETFLLARFVPGYAPFDPQFSYLFNSYYEAAGPRHPRPQRGMLSRPSADRVTAYRHAVDDAMGAFLETAGERRLREAEGLVMLGCHHEQQHQELLLMDILHAFAQNPMLPAYRRQERLRYEGPTALTWTNHAGGEVAIGAAGDDFAFDNEGPRHAVRLQPFRLASRLTTNEEWLAFMEDGGYRRPELWLSDGWSYAQANAWQAPLYWREVDGRWCQFSLNGEAEVMRGAPVCHVSYYEADAFARWSGKRLPTEAEWEAAAQTIPTAGNFLEDGALAPLPAHQTAQLYGDVWEWTQSAYLPYPGFRAAPGAVGEYNGKFMINQMVLRGGSCVTPRDHVRPSYRNFFYPHQRWMFAGVRLADDPS
jgi:ergothioneine biosynthesis protein EgtB